ncbi:MAG TPA: alpha/beta hydrolase fold domain-containing protein, partial [Pedococcus sp.]|nr:alpha/beta hydrolase fold domain-containing protein [Pedococcus sp.]
DAEVHAVEYRLAPEHRCPAAVDDVVTATVAVQSRAGDLPVIVGGIIPASDARALVERGVAAVYTPKDFGLTAIMGGFVDVIRAAHGLDEER